MEWGGPYQHEAARPEKRRSGTLVVITAVAMGCLVAAGKGMSFERGSMIQKYGWASFHGTDTATGASIRVHVGPLAVFVASSDQDGHQVSATAEWGSSQCPFPQLCASCDKSASLTYHLFLGGAMFTLASVMAVARVQDVGACFTGTVSAVASVLLAAACYSFVNGCAAHATADLPWAPDATSGIRASADVSSTGLHLMLVALAVEVVVVLSSILENCAPQRNQPSLFSQAATVGPLLGVSTVPKFSLGGPQVQPRQQGIAVQVQPRQQGVVVRVPRGRVLMQSKAAVRSSSTSSLYAPSFSPDDDPLFMDEESVAAETWKGYPISQDSAIYKAKEFLHYEQGLRKADLLGEDFKFMGPFVGGEDGLGKEQFLKAIGGFKITDGFPDLVPGFHHFRTDPMDAGRVWFTSASTGTHLGVFLNHKPTGKKFQTPPQACSIKIGPDGRVVKYTIGHVMERSMGNTGGMGGIFGPLYAIGKPLPFREGRPWKPSRKYRFFMWLGSLADRKSEKK